LRLKNELPMAKRALSSSLSVANGNEKAFLPLAYTVVAPPVNSPTGMSSPARAYKPLHASNATKVVPAANARATAVVIKCIKERSSSS
jgi:hypothetical protein